MNNSLQYTIANDLVISHMLIFLAVLYVVPELQSTILLGRLRVFGGMGRFSVDV